MKYSYQGLLSLISFALVGFVLSCTNLSVDTLNDRMSDNWGGGLTTPGNITIATPNLFSFAVMGDTHVGSPGDTMKTFVQNSAASGDSFVVMAGDLTHGGREGEYNQFMATMGLVTLPFRTAIGNHDIFFGGWEFYRKTFGRSIYSFDAGSVHFTMLDSANGTLGSDQLEWLDRDLQGTNKALKVVVSHFSPWIDPGFVSSYYVLESDEESIVLKDILSRNHVNLYFAGHYHGYADSAFGGVRYIVTGAANDMLDPGNERHYMRVRVNNGTLSVTKVAP